MKANRKLLVGIFTGLLSTTFVSAQAFRDSFGPFWDLIDYLFNYLPSNSSTQGAYFKFLLWIMFFSLYVVLVRKLDIFKRAEQRKQGNIVAMILSLMTVLLMPNTILVAIFTSYSYLGALVLTFVLPITIIFYTRNMDYRVRAGSQILGGFFLVAFTPTFWSEFTQPWTKTLSSFMSIGGFALIINGILGLTNQGKGIFGNREGGGNGKTPEQIAENLKSLDVKPEDTPDKVKKKVEKELGTKKTLNTVDGEIKDLAEDMRKEARDLEQINNLIKDNGPVGNMVNKINVILSNPDQEGISEMYNTLYPEINRDVVPLHQGLRYLSRVARRDNRHYRRLEKALNELTKTHKVAITMTSLGKYYGKSDLGSEAEQFKKAIDELREKIGEIEQGERQYVASIAQLRGDILGARREFNKLRSNLKKLPNLDEKRKNDTLVKTRSMLQDILNFRQPVVDAYASLRKQYDDIREILGGISKNLQVLSDALIIKLAERVGKKKTQPQQE